MKNTFLMLIYLIFIASSNFAASQTSCAIQLPSQETTETSGFFKIKIKMSSQDVNRVLVPTWGIENWQDDLIWYEGIYIGNGEWYANIDLSKHKIGNPEYGKFNTHVYARKDSGVENLCGATEWRRIKPQAPSCTSAYPTKYKTYSHNGFQRIYATGVANAQNVVFPTWGESGGQNDLVWYDGVNAGDGIWYADIDLSNHSYGNPEYGNFNTHVYAKSSSGIEALCAATKWKRPQIIAFATGNLINGWSDVAINSRGHLAMAEDIKNNFCNPECPDGKYSIGMSYTLDLLRENSEQLKPIITAQLKALVKSAKDNKFQFFIHANHEWVLVKDENPFGQPSFSWAEYTFWNTPLTTYYTGWDANSAQGLKPNFESIVFRNKVKNDIKYISDFILTNILNDEEAKSLFMGVDIGWETEVQPSAFVETRIGYAALSNRINPLNGRYFGENNPPMDFDSALGDVARDFVVFLSDEYKARGIPKDLLISHVTANSGQDGPRMKRTPFNASSIAGINFGVSSFGVNFNFSRINSQRGQLHWIISETDPATGLSSINGGGLLPPPSAVIIYNWSDTMRNKFNGKNMIQKYKSLFQLTND